MPAAVGFSTYVAIAARPDRKLVIHSEEFPGSFEFDLDHLPEQRTGAWCDYVLGVASVLRQHGHNLQGANLLVHGEVPIGAGLSSSAAVEVASALALMSLFGNPDSRCPRSPSCASRRRTISSVPASESWTSSSPAWEEPGTPFFSIAAPWNFSWCQSPPVSASSSATRWSGTIWPPGPTTRAAKSAKKACAISRSGIPQFVHCAMCRSKCSISISHDLPATIGKRCSHVVRENRRTLECCARSHGR